MLTISETDEAYLKKRIQKCEGVLVLGAGSVRDCKNARHHDLKLGNELAAEICADAGLPYNNDLLSDVLDAVKLPIAQFNALLEREYKGCSASEDLKNAFSVPWRRVYTFNIDDSIESIQGTLSKQTIYSYNALHSKISPYEGPRVLHAVHLNGYVRELDKGVIFSKLDYDRRLSQQELGWYREAAEDHFRYCSIFIGTKLSEPLLWAELERIRESSDYSRSFLIIPDDLSPIQKASLANRGITVIRGTFQDFTRYIKSLFPKGLDWSAVVEAESGLLRAKQHFTKEEVEALGTARRVQPSEVAARWNNLTEERKRLSAREFYMGRPPSWELAISDVPVRLVENENVKEFLRKAVDERARLAVVTGQAGCGKTTAAMVELLRLVRSRDDVDLTIFLASGDWKFMRRHEPFGRFKD